MPEPRIAFLTGAASGIGRETAHRLAAAGLVVVIADRRGAAEAAAALPGTGHRGLTLDVTDEAQIASAFAEIETGIGPIAILVTLAGVFPWPQDGSKPSIVATTVEEWNATFAVNALGCFLPIREMLRWRGRVPVADGRIVTISSSAAQLGGYNGSAAYAGSKGAVLSLALAILG